MRHHRRRRHRCQHIGALAILAALVLGASSRAHAQVVHGLVVESGSRQPLYGSIIVLLDSANTQLAGAITDSLGRFTLTAPAPGRYTLRANRIGFRSTRSEPFTLAAGQTLDETLVASTVPVQLATIDVTGKERCTTRPEEGRAAFVVWEEVRTALTAATLTLQQRLLNVRIRDFDRDVDPRDHHVLREQNWEQNGVSASPFVAVSADSLESSGYAHLSDTASWYYAPDANVLLSDAFSAHHCFRVQQSDSMPKQLIGLAFEPVRHRKVPDVQGVLWLDRTTSELRTMEFHYTGLPRAISKDVFGGTIAFRRLPTGAWIVQRWVLRMPVLHAELRPRSAFRPEYRDTVIAAIHETGGAVLTATTRNGTPLTLTEAATLRGTVFDSTRGAPLVHALVMLAGTADSTRTDSLGAFQLDGLSDGEYTIAVSQARLDSLAARPLTRNVTLRRGIVSTVRLGVPSLASIVRNACPDSLRADTMALVAGTVRTADSGRPLANALVTVSWTTWTLNAHIAKGSSHGIEVSTDSLGHYHACGVPAGLLLGITAQVGKVRSATDVVKPLSGGELVLRELKVAKETPE
jgi:protocatechuate 3,4-dioxygenase beta subunit